jgi:cytochrome c oxidase subunit 4
MSATGHNHEGHGELGHIVPLSIYRAVFITLIALTVITVVVAKAPVFQFAHEWINVFVAILIATIKASLVAMFFMHLKYENKLTWLYVFFPLFLLALLIGLLFLDNPFRKDARDLSATVTHTAPASHHGAAHH